MRIIGLLFFWISQVQAEGRSIFQDKNNNGVSNDTLRQGDMSVKDIPWIILAVTNNLLYMVGYISLGVILIGSLMYILSGTHENLKNKGKDALKAALVGAVVSWTGWILVNFFIDNL